MISGLTHLTLEVRSLDQARQYYEDRLRLTPVHGSAVHGSAVHESDPNGEKTERLAGCEAVYALGDTALILRRPLGAPRGGLHTHYAFTAPPGAYETWQDRLDDLDLVEREFGSYRSLYVDDLDGHCVEIGSAADEDPTASALTGIFELVLEVTDLDRSERVYRSLGFEVVDRGSDRRRVRLRAPFDDHFDLELWEPQLGIADARGGVHVDFGFKTSEPAVAVATIANDVCDVERLADGYRVVDPDGHSVSFRTGSLVGSS